MDIATDGEDGFNKALNNNYDMVLMDVQMPNWDGLQATMKLRDSGYKKPIVALTAHAMDEERRKCFLAGCTDHLAKPTSREQLVSVIEKYSKK